ncbi:hypothetical protein LMG6003_04675 [Achromobacter insolitus]|nr:hypothetical protein LMG6003_04675 [Achromobacter insolitus]
MAQALVARDLQRAAIDAGAAAIGIDAVQHQRAGPGLDERAASRHQAGQAQRRASSHVDAARLRQHHGTRDVERAGGGQRATVERQAACGGAQVRVTADTQDAVGNRRAADVAVAAVQDHRAAAALDEPACSRHRAVHAQRGRRCDVEASRLRKRYGARGRKGSRRGQRTAMECQAAYDIAQVRIAIDLQGACLDRRAAVMAVAAAQDESAPALFHETGSVRNRRGKAQRRACRHVEAAGLRQHDRSRDIECACGRQRATAEYQCAGRCAQAGIAAYTQVAVSEDCASAVVIAAAHDQCAGAALDERAVTRHRTAQSQRRACANVEHSRLCQQDGTRTVEAAGGRQHPGVQGQAAGRRAEIGVALDLQHATFDPRAAGVGIDAGQAQSSGARCGQRARA